MGDLDRVHPGNPFRDTFSPQHELGHLAEVFN